MVLHHGTNLCDTRIRGIRRPKIRMLSASAVLKERVVFHLDVGMRCRQGYGDVEQAD